MTQITRAIALSILQYSDRRFQRAVLKSIVLAIFALWAKVSPGKPRRPTGNDEGRPWVDFEMSNPQAVTAIRKTG